MRQLVECVLLIVLSYSVIELFTNIFLAAIYASPELTSFEALTSSKLSAMQAGLIILCVLALRGKQ